MPSYKKQFKITMTDGVSIALNATDPFERYYISGSPTLTTNWAITMATPKEGMVCYFEYKATPTTGANTVTILGTAIPSDLTSKKLNIEAHYNGSAWVVDIQPSSDESDIITSAMIKSLNGAKLEADSVPFAKLADLTANTIPVVNASKKIESSATTPTELAVLHGVTAGTATAGKAVVTDGSNKIAGIAEADIQVLKINGQTVEASGTELSELNSAGVVNADFVVLAGANAAGVAAADLQLLAGLNTAGVTNDDLLGVAAESAAKAQRKTAVQTDDYTIDESTQVLCLTLTADAQLEIPNGLNNTKQFITIMIVANPASAFDVILHCDGNDFLFDGAVNSDSCLITTPPTNSVIFLSNSAASTWTVAKAS